MLFFIWLGINESNTRITKAAFIANTQKQAIGITDQPCQRLPALPKCTCSARCFPHNIVAFYHLSVVISVFIAYMPPPFRGIRQQKRIVLKVFHTQKTVAQIPVCYLSANRFAPSCDVKPAKIAKHIYIRPRRSSLKISPFFKPQAQKYPPSFV